MTKKVADHVFVPCHHPEKIVRALGGCLNPTGFDGCHIKGCGLPREVHPVCTCLSIGRDPLCWFHGDRDKELS
jgi:hypothetical protein